MKVLTTFHPSSSVSHSVKCCLTKSKLEHLVVAKLNRIDVYSLQPSGLRHECGLEIWGKILSLKAIPAVGSRSNILLMLDHPDPELMFLSYCVFGNGADLRTMKRISLCERSARQAEYFNDVVLDATGQLAVVSCYTGKLKLILLKHGNYESDFDVSISELTVLALAFVSSTDDAQILAILHFDSEEHIQLLSRDIHIEDLELSHSPSTLLPSTAISTKTLPMSDSHPILISVPPSQDLGFLGGVLLIGGRKILFFELASRDWQEKHKGKERRLESKKKSLATCEAQEAKQKEVERRLRKRRPKSTVEWPWSEVTAWCSIDSTSGKYFLGDSFGRLAMLSLDISEDNELMLLPLGESSPPTTLTYLTTQVLYLGSHMGNSHLLRLNSTPVSALDSPTLAIPADITTLSRWTGSSAVKGKGRTNSHVKQGCVIDSRGTYISVLETYKNIAPISDAVLVEADGSGQRQIITCSGGQNTGSINVIRNGADFEELAVIAGISNVINIWPIRATFEDKLDVDIVVSTLQDTHVFRLNGRNALTRVEQGMGIVTTQPTLALANIPRRLRKDTAQASSSYKNSSLIIQVTPKGLVLLQFQMSSGEYTRMGQVWTPDRMSDSPLRGPLSWTGREVLAASINPSQVALALSGSILVLLNLSENDEFNVLSYCDLSSSGHEISAVSCAPPDPTKYFSTYIVVSFWQSNHIELISIERSQPCLRSLCKTCALPSLPRSLLLLNFDTAQTVGSDNCAHLLAGLSDGTVVSFAFKNKEFSDEKVVSLGDSPVSLTACEIDGRRTVFGCGSRVSIFCWDKNRLHQSSVLLKDVVTVSRLNTELFTSCLILATPTSLSIGRARDLDKIHIRSFPLGLDNPRRITHDPSLNIFGICCVRPEPSRVGDPESSRSSFRLLDGTSFSHLSQFNCEPYEETTAVEILSQDSSTTLFCVGTFSYQFAEHEPTNGRLLVFAVHSEGSSLRSPQLSLISSADVQGCVYALAIVRGLIAVAVNASVILFRMERKDQSATLQKVAEWSHNYVVRNLVSHGEILVLGDAINSISVLKLAGDQLHTVARDFGPLWPVCVQALDEKTVIAASGDLNIYTFALRQSETQIVLEREGGYHVAEMITKFIPGTLDSPEASCDFLLEAKQLFVTSSGRIGVILDIGDELSLHMTALQRNMARIAATGHTKYRAVKNSRGHGISELPSFGFLDGDLLEQLLGCNRDLEERIYAGGCDIERLVMPLSQIHKFLETLRSMH